MFPVKDNIRTDRVAFVTLVFMALNIAAYVWERKPGNGLLWDGPSAGFIDQHDALPYSLFLSPAFLPLAANMMFLWVFGNSVEDAMGRIRYACFYLLGGLVTIGVAYAIGGEPVALVGSTGAVAAVLGGYLFYYPHGKVLCLVPIPLFVTIVEVVAIAFLGVWIALQILFAALGLTDPVGGDDAVAYAAPAAGLLFGAATVKLFAVRPSPSHATAPE